MDLVENLSALCPKCGGRLVSLGIDSVRWNHMDVEGKKALIIRVLTEPELRPAISSESEQDLAKRADALSELIKQAETRDVQVRRAREELEISRRAEALVEDALQEIQKAELAKQRAKIRYVYICSKCSSIAAHDSAGYSCTCSECSSPMEYSGCTTVQWARLSKEEKRKICEQAQLNHIISAIRVVSDDTGDDGIQNIISVIPDE